jgi:hypothetical protein
VDFDHTGVGTDGGGRVCDRTLAPSRRVMEATKKRKPLQATSCLMCIVVCSPKLCPYRKLDFGNKR